MPSARVFAGAQDGAQRGVPSALELDELQVRVLLQERLEGIGRYLFQAFGREYECGFPVDEVVQTAVVLQKPVAVAVGEKSPFPLTPFVFT